MSARTLVGLALILFAQALQCALTTAAPPQLLDMRKPQGPSVLWTTALGFTGEATVAGDAILIGTTNSSSVYPRDRDKWTTIIPHHKGAPEGANSMVCLDARTGKLRWRSLHPMVESRRYGIPYHPVTSKPWIDGKRVYYLSVNWEFVCLDLKGFLDNENDGPFKNETLHGKEDADIIWKIDLRKDLGIEPRTAGDVGYVQSSPVGYGDLVYLVTGNGRDYQHGVQTPDAPSFLAVNKSTGKVEWSSRAPGKNIIHMQGGSPVILPKTEEVVFPGGDGFLYGVDAMGLRIGMAGGFLLCTDSNGELIIVAPGDKPKLIGKYDVDLLIPSYGRATTSKYGICLPLGEGDHDAPNPEVGLPPIVAQVASLNGASA